MKHLLSIVMALVAVVAFAPRVACQAPGNYQVQEWNEGQARWDNYDPAPFASKKHEVDGGDLADVRPTGSDDYFEWEFDGKTLRILKDLLPKESIRQGLQQAADRDSKVIIYVDSSTGCINKISVR